MPALRPLPDDHRGLIERIERTAAEGDVALVVEARRRGPLLREHAAQELPEVARRAMSGIADLPRDAFVAVLSSGSTGEPRPIVIGRTAWQAAVTAGLQRIGARPGDRWVLALPLTHVGGLQVVARAAALGTQVERVEDPGDPMSIAASLDAAVSQGIRSSDGPARVHISIVPTQLVRCLDAGVDLARATTVLVGGGPLPHAVHRQALDAGVNIIATYGMTETCGGCVYDGMPLDGVEVGIADDGRIRLRGPMVASGELVFSGEGEVVMRSLTDAHGWFTTSDAGHIDPPSGRLLVDGRLDDVIVSGGVNVSAAAVAEILRAHPSVEDAVAFGVADREWGQALRVVIVAAPDDKNHPMQPSALLTELRRTVTTRLDPAHAPRSLVLVARLERDGLGKVRAEVRDRLLMLPVDAAV
jgi:O-succinylbenzoic acid--CoA ligase